MDSAHFYRQAGNMPMPGQGRGSPMPQPHYAQSPVSYKSPQGQDNARKRTNKSSSSSRQAAPQQPDDGGEPSGDELDDISARDIAMARYKRNHDYFSEIFTPYNADSIVPPPLDISQSKEDLLQLIDEQQQSAKEQQEQHDNKIKQFKQEHDQFWKSIAILNEATSLEAIEEATQAMAATIGSKVEHNTDNVYAIQIPGLKDEPVVMPTPPTNQTQQPSSEQQQQPLSATSSSSSPTTGQPLLQQQPTPTQPSHLQPSLLPSQQQQQQQQDQQQHMQPSNMINDDVDMFTNFDQTPPAADDDGNDFFNEMVNTGQDDDDPSVSEFLNSDMDFDQPEKQDDTMQE